MQINNQMNIHDKTFENRNRNSISNPSFGQLNLKEYPKLAAAAITAAATGLMAVNINKSYNIGQDSSNFKNDLKNTILIKPQNLEIQTYTESKDEAYSTVDNALINCIKEAELKGLSEEELFNNIYNLYNELSDEELESIANSYNKDDCSMDDSIQLNVWLNLQDRKQLLKDLVELHQQVPNTENDKLSIYVLKLINIREDNIRKNELAIKERILSTIQYDKEYKPSLEKVNLTQEEFQDAKEIYERYWDKLGENISEKRLKHAIINDWVSGCGQYRYTDRMYRYAFQDLDNYISRDTNGNYNRQPVYRWVNMNRISGNNLYGDIKNKIKIGEIYNPERIQSCSKNPFFAENEFGDANVNMNLKFIIHPKSNISRAKDIGERKYGNREVVYMQGEKFRVLDKRIVKYRIPLQEYNYKTQQYEEVIKTAFRYIVEMQEV